MKTAKWIFGGLRDTFAVLAGWLVYAWSGRTPQYAYRAMINLFCRTRGRSNDVMSRLISVVRPPYRLPEHRGVLGQLDQAALAEIGGALRDKGFYLFPQRLPDEICDRLTAYAFNHECDVRVMDTGVAKGEKPRRAIYDPLNIQGVRYEFSQQEVINIPDVQMLLSDLSILAVAQEYLRSRPIADVTGLWWHTAFGEVPDKEAAQYFHFDMDRVKWLKFFIYLTDVNANNGPHSFVAGSHRTGGIPEALLRLGYSRLEDSQVGSCFDRKDVIEFSAPRGTILAEDTRGLHKGKHVKSGHRLMLQLQYSNSLFGATYEPARLTAEPVSSLLELARRYPAIYANFTALIHSSRV